MTLLAVLSGAVLLFDLLYLLLVFRKNRNKDEVEQICEQCIHTALDCESCICKEEDGWR